MDDKNYKIRQYINGVFIGLTDITCTKQAYKSLLSIMLLPENGMIIKEYLLFKVFIQDDRTRGKVFFKIALPVDKGERDLYNVLLGNRYNDVKADSITLTLGKHVIAKNIIKQGRDFENYVSDYYKNQGFTVINNFEKNVEDEGIDIILINDDELCLIQCKNWEIQSIRDKEIKEFLGNCYMFLYKNISYRKYKKIRRIYITSKSNLDDSAKYLLKNYYPFVEYLLLPF